MDSGETGFRRLIVWQKAQDFALPISEEVANLAGGRRTDVIANQLLRSVGWISANIAEGYGRFYSAASEPYLDRARVVV